MEDYQVGDKNPTPAQNQRRLILGFGCAAGAVILVGTAVGLYAGRGDRGRAGGKYADAPTAKMLAAHPWWAGKGVTPEKVSAILDALEAGTAGREPREITLYFDDRGEFSTIPEVMWPGDRSGRGDQVVSWGIASRKYPEVWNSLRRPLRRVEIVKPLRENNPTREELASLLEESLYGEGDKYTRP